MIIIIIFRVGQKIEYMITIIAPIPIMLRNGILYL